MSEYKVNDKFYCIELTPMPGHTSIPTVFNCVVIDLNAKLEGFLHSKPFRYFKVKWNNGVENILHITEMKTLSRTRKEAWDKFFEVMDFCVKSTARQVKIYQQCYKAEKQNLKLYKRIAKEDLKNET